MSKERKLGVADKALEERETIDGRYGMFAWCAIEETDHVSTPRRVPSVDCMTEAMLLKAKIALFQDNLNDT